MTPPVAASVINWNGLFIAIPLVLVVLLVGWWFSRHQKKRRKKPGMLLYYTAPRHSATACRGLLLAPGPGDVFGYTLTGTAAGWYLHITRHNPTGQVLDTLFLMQFEGDEPAVFALRFVREAFGMPEPIIGEALLDAFFAQKLGARRISAPGASDETLS